MHPQMRLVLLAGISDYAIKSNKQLSLFMMIFRCAMFKQNRNAAPEKVAFIVQTPTEFRS